MNLKRLLQVIIQEFDKTVKNTQVDSFGLVFTISIVALFFISGILGILNNFMIKVLLFSALALLLFYCILVMDKNKNHPD
jgi:hypothetical protein